MGKGNTASQIAEIIGGVTRNAVIGKAHRLNLSGKIITKKGTLNNKNNKFYNNHHVVDLDILSVKKIFKVLDSNKIKHIIFAGSIKRPGIKDLGFDLPTFLLAKSLLLEKKGGKNGILKRS